MNLKTLELIAREKGMELLGGTIVSPLTQAYIHGYKAGHMRAAMAGHNLYVTSKPWLHHPDSMLEAVIADLLYELEPYDE